MMTVTVRDATEIGTCVEESTLVLKELLITSNNASVTRLEATAM